MLSARRNGRFDQRYRCGVAQADRLAGAEGEESRASRREAVNRQAELTRVSRVLIQCVSSALPVFRSKKVLRTPLIVLLTLATRVIAGSSQEPDTGVAESTAVGAEPTATHPMHDAWASRALTYQRFSAEAGGGYDFVTGSANDYIRGGADATVGVSWFPSRALPVGLRLDGSYEWFTPGRQLLGLGGVNYTQGERKVYGGDLDLQLDIAGASSRQKAYLLGGFGEYRMATSLQQLSAAPLVCGNNFCGRYPTVLATENDTSAWAASWNAGVGWAMALDAHTSLFIEARYRRIFTRGSNTQFVPVRIGLRF